jgi:hypothetical protein
LRRKLDAFNQTYASSKSLKQLPETIFHDSAVLIEKQKVGNRRWEKVKNGVEKKYIILFELTQFTGKIKVQVVTTIWQFKNIRRLDWEGPWFQTLECKRVKGRGRYVHFSLLLPIDTSAPYLRA